MTSGRSRTFFEIISAPCLMLALTCGAMPAAYAERVLDLQFWAPEHAALALGGLWEFHAQTLLEPGQRRLGSEHFFEISQPWRDYRPVISDQPGPLQRGSYVLLIKGLMPRAQGYVLQTASGKSMTRMIVAPKYAPERAQRVQTGSLFAVFPVLRSFAGPKLQLVFTPRALDEIWMIIVQRWQAAPEARGSIPRLQFAASHP